MTDFQGLPRAVLVAISRASGDMYRDIDGEELVRELAQAGHEPESIALYNLMFQLRDAGFLAFSAGGGMDIENFGLIRLDTLGRQEVEGWPTSARVSAGDVEALIRAFEAHAQNPDAPSQDRQKAGQAASAARDLGVEVTGSIVASWLRGIGIG